jgi:hypothetical protein
MPPFWIGVALVAIGSTYSAYSSYRAAGEQKKAYKAQMAMAREDLKYKKQINRLKLQESREASRVAALERIRVARIARAQMRMKAIASGLLPGITDTGYGTTTEQAMSQGFFGAYDIANAQLRTDENYAINKYFSERIMMFQENYNRHLGSIAEWQGHVAIGQGISAIGSAFMGASKKPTITPETTTTATTMPLGTQGLEGTYTLGGGNNFSQWKVPDYNMNVTDAWSTSPNYSLRR